MKAIMYHYVRTAMQTLPYFRYLDVENFRRQLDMFAHDFGFGSQFSFLRAFEIQQVSENSVILTFDDGLSDHYSYVFSELKSRGLWGIFYIPTSPYVTGRLLDVHRIHVLLGMVKGGVLAAEARDILSGDMLSHEHIEEYHTATYSSQIEEDGVIFFKRLLNFFISYEHRTHILDLLMKRHVGNEAKLTKSYYLAREDIAALKSAGMIIGNHGVNHLVFSKLSINEQEREIEESFSLLEEMAGGLNVRTFCYPYGGFHTFTPDTEALLDKHGCLFSFNVEARDISQQDILHRPQALPRYDCNFFPYGSITACE